MDLNLFSPLSIGSLKLPNRVVMAPMSRLRSGSGSAPRPIAAEYYVQRASAGLLITESIATVSCGDGYPPVPGIYSDQQLEAWRWVVAAVHGAGGRIAAQLSHVIRARTADGTPRSGWWALENAITPGDLSEQELLAIPNDFANGALRSIDASFDAVEIHNANGFFFDRMLRPTTNPRSDAFGGSLENRVRLSLGIVEAVASAIGGQKVGIRLSPNAVFDGKLDSESRNTFSYLISALKEYNLAYIHVTRPEKGTVDERDPSFVQISEIREMYDGLIIANGSFDQDEASNAISSGLADAISFARPFISNPDLVRRFKVGLSLAEPDKATFYTPGMEGYVDYPFYDDAGPGS